jgi:hypothetical protein
MRLPTINLRLFLAYLLLLALLPFGYGQKIREKKDIISVDDVPLYKFIRTKGGLGKAEHEHVIMTMDNDTLVWYKYVALALRKQEHEKFPPKDNYWELRFKGTEEAVPYKLSGSYYHELIKLGVLKDGKLDLAALPAFKEEIAPQLKYILMMQEANAHREKLEALPNYANYSKGLVKRSADNILYVDNGRVFYQNSTGGQPDNIGYYKSVNFPQGTQFDVYRNSDRMLVATITNKAFNGDSSIKTFVDGATYDYNVRLDHTFISHAVHYLIWFGYL